MSELKWNWVYYPYLETPYKQEESALKAGYIKVVIKDEADKVIADLEESHKMEVEQLLMEIVELKDKLQNVSGLLKETREWLIESQRLHKRCADGAIKKIRHSNFKRCLAMAKWCRTSARYDESVGAIKYRDWYCKWRKRWLDLAEKFKEEK